MEITIEQMEQALREINFFVGGLTDAGIQYYYNKMVNEGKIQTTNDMTKNTIVVQVKNGYYSRFKLTFPEENLTQIAKIKFNTVRDIFEGENKGLYKASLLLS